MEIMKDCRMRRMVMFIIWVMVFFAVTAVLMWVWNQIIPWVVGFPEITYWQAAGLLIVTRILLGGFTIVGRFSSRLGGCSCGSDSGKENSA